MIGELRRKQHALWRVAKHCLRVAEQMPVQRDGSMAFRLGVLREQPTCFWAALALCMPCFTREGAGNYGAVKEWFDGHKRAGHWSSGVSIAGAVAHRRLAPFPFGLFQFDGESPVQRIADTTEDYGVMYCNTFDGEGHWVPVGHIRKNSEIRDEYSAFRNVGPFARLSPEHVLYNQHEVQLAIDLVGAALPAQDAEEVPDPAPAAQQEAAVAAEEATHLVRRPNILRDFYADRWLEETLGAREQAVQEVEPDWVMVEGGVEDADIGDWVEVQAEAAETRPALPRVRYIHTVSASPPFNGRMFQRGTTTVGRANEQLSNWWWKPTNFLLGRQALETHLSVLNGAMIDASTILFCRANGNSPIDARLNKDGAIHLQSIKTLMCDGATYVLGDIHYCTEGDESWMWAGVVLRPRAWPCLPRIHDSFRISRVCIVERPNLPLAKEDFSSAEDWIRAQYSLVRTAGVIPDELVGILNDMKVGHLANPEFERRAENVAETLTMGLSNLQRLGQPMLKWGYA